MRKTKLLCLVFSAVMIASTVLSGCSSSGSSASSTSSSSGKADTSKEVKITGYLLGAAPAGMKDVMTKLNEKLKKDINATMDINYIGWGDMQSKYPLVLASGDDVDWIFTADWAYYQQEASKSAFAEIKEADLKKYMPLHYAKLDKTAYSQADIKGKNYMIPSSTPDKKIQAAVIRGDLRKKYNIPEIKSVDQLGPYLEAIKKNEPNMIPFNLDSQYDPGTIFSNMQNAFGYATSINLIESVTFDTLENSPKLNDLMGPNDGESGKKAATMLKDWYDKGYINKNPFANKVRSKDSLVQGKSAVGIGNSVDLQSTLTQGKTAGMSLEVIPVLKNGKSAANSYLNNGVAISASSKNPERTMMALDLIMEDKAYDYLVYYGIEGKNYSITSDNKIGLPSGVTTDNNTYPADSAGFWFTNKDLFLPSATWTDEYLSLKKQIPSMLVTSPWATFSFDQTNVKTEMATLTQVDQQYFNPIEVGAVKNVDDAIKTLRDKQKAAGWQKVYDEVQKQANTYFKK